MSTIGGSEKMIIEKAFDETDSFFIKVPNIYSKKTKTYPRITGWYSFRKANKLHYPRYLHLEGRSYHENDEFPLSRNEWNEFQRLQESFSDCITLYFTFDVKQSSHCVVDYICTVDRKKESVISAKSRLNVSGLFWQNKIYQKMMKDKHSLRRLDLNHAKRLFNQAYFWNTCLSEYVFSLLKI